MSIRLLRLTILIGAVMSITQQAAAQELSFSSPEGETVTLSSMRGRVVVLMFGGVQDPQCRDEFRALESLAERFQGRELSIFWVSVNSATEVSSAGLKRPCGIATTVPVLRDQNQAAFKRFGGRALPTLVLLNQKGELHGRPRAGFNPNSDFVNDLASIVDSLLAQK